MAKVEVLVVLISVVAVTMCREISDEGEIGKKKCFKVRLYDLLNKTDFNFSGDLLKLFRFRFTDHETSIKHKPISHSTFLTMKQKRYKRRKTIPARVKFIKDLRKFKI